MEIVEQEGFQPMWNKIIVLACVIAVSLDPLFLYIPTIDQEHKCFELDKKLRVLALVWRFIFDLIYVMDIVYNIAKAYKVEKRREPPNSEIKKIGIHLVKSGRISWNLIVVDLLSILPIPQSLLDLGTIYQRDLSDGLSNPKQARRPLRLNIKLSQQQQIEPINCD
ncbi:hypothetical protein L484_008483 [Morus notabilis]|uniref:Ion transport domain-containing protein n=1 Tax=Morus notabilis TaxID=981085 RepID=W9SVK5_9ROSA|nr:hypothetical protein L484_008483 [Morus notabilis]